MSDSTPIDRVDTAIRVALSLLFIVITGAIELVLRVVVMFSLVYALVTRELPSERVRRFANQITAYLYRIYRYLTYNDARAPFPFAELERPLEPGRWSAETTESGLLRRSRARDAVEDPVQE